MKIELFAEPEDVSPEHVEEASEGFAAAVREVMGDAVDPWGWCTVIVRVTTPDGVGEDTLGECSYTSALDFIQNSGYFLDMVKDALEEIKV